MQTSTVAQLRERIAAEIEAMNTVFHGYAEVARHRIIEHKYEQLGTYQEQLSELIGPTAAIKILTEELNEHTTNHSPLPIRESQPMSHFD
jgi:hypothetical protein